MNKRNRIESFSAREDDLDDLDLGLALPRKAEPSRRSGSLVLQIALGVWLGGMALALTGFGLAWLGVAQLLPDAPVQMILR